MINTFNFKKEDRTIGETIKQLRASKQLTQEELGRIIGVTTSIIGMYETGARTPSLNVMELIADFFKVSVDYLLGRTEYLWSFLSDHEVTREIDDYIRKVITHYCNDDFKNIALPSFQKDLFIKISGLLSSTLSHEHYHSFTKLNLSHQEETINRLFKISSDLRLVPLAPLINYEGKYISDRVEQSEDNNSATKPTFKLVPVVSKTTGMENSLYEYVPSDLAVDFCLRVQGDYMINARILDGDLAYIHEQADVESGEIAAVLINDPENLYNRYEAVLRRVYKVNDIVILRSENPNYLDTTYSHKEMNNLKILGKAIAFRSNVK